MAPEQHLTKEQITAAVLRRVNGGERLTSTSERWWDWINPFVVRFDGEEQPLPPDVCDFIAQHRLLKVRLRRRDVRELAVSVLGARFLRRLDHRANQASPTGPLSNGGVPMTPDQHMTPEPRLKEPQPEEFVGYMHCRYKGRDFYGEHAHDIAELNYLCDWKRWAEQELRTFTAFARALNEVLNRGDGSHRP